MNTRWLGAALVAAALIAPACGSDDPPAATASSSPAPPTAPPSTLAPVQEDVPQRIVSLSPTHTEMLFAIGAGGQVIAVDEYSNYPADVLALPHDLSGFTPNVEAIAAFQPDLVVIGDDFNDLTGQLAALDIEVWSGPSATTFDDVYDQLEQLGAVTGHIAEAAAVVAGMKVDIDAAVAAAPKPAEPLTYYHELEQSLYSVTSNTFIGQVYALFGLENIADDAQPGNDYPQLSAELVITANPDVIFLADSKCCGQTAATVAARDGWGEIAAVRSGGVIEMDDDIASRWGPRIVDYIEAVSQALQSLPAAVG